MGSICECPENLCHDNEMLMSTTKNSFHSKTQKENGDDVEEVKGLINKTPSRRKFKNLNMKHFAIDKGASISLNIRQSKNFNNDKNNPLKQSINNSYLCKKYFLFNLFSIFFFCFLSLQNGR